MCKLLALKANDKGTDRKNLIYEIYKTASNMADQLDNDKKLLIEQWIQAYKKVSPDSVERIKKEVNMSFAATTISEHIWNEGKVEGKVEGKAEGKAEGKVEMIEEMYRVGILTKEQLEKMLEPLKQQLKAIQDCSKPALTAN
jgi:flagellar biosynthesis/type III secretory pathway protein FliH